jgi:hypothetical protein
MDGVGDGGCTGGNSASSGSSFDVEAKENVAGRVCEEDESANIS